MHFVTVAYPTDKAYCLPIGDIHWGDRAFKKQGLTKLKGNLDWLVEHQDHAFGILVGDIFNIAGRDSKTSPFESDPEEILEAEEFFRPYAHLFKVGVRGNHERRLVNAYGFDPMKVFCNHLGIPYAGVSSLIRVQVGARKDNPGWFNQSYYMALHHTTGGGRMLGSALNGVEQLAKIIPGCDVYVGGHNHQLVTGVRSVLVPTPYGPKPLKTHFVSCGSYLDYEGSYAEEGLYQPGKLGSPRIRFSGLREKHDVHVSI